MPCHSFRDVVGRRPRLRLPRVSKNSCIRQMIGFSVPDFCVINSRGKIVKAIFCGSAAEDERSWNLKFREKLQRTFVLLFFFRLLLLLWVAVLPWLEASLELVSIFTEGSVPLITMFRSRYHWSLTGSTTSSRVSLGTAFIRSTTYGIKMKKKLHFILLF